MGVWSGNFFCFFFFFFLYDGVDIDIKECVICKRVMECAEVNKEVFLIS